MLAAAAATALTAWSCAKDNTEDIAPAGDGAGMRTLTVDCSEAVRTSIGYDEGGSFLDWTEGDKVAYATDKDVAKEATIADNKLTIEVSEGASQLFLVYPVGSNVGKTAAELTAAIKASATQSKASVLNGANLPMFSAMALPEGNVVEHPVFTVGGRVVRFAVNSAAHADERVIAVRITAAEGSVLAASFDASLAPVDGTASNTVLTTLSTYAPMAADNYIYAVVAPGNYKGVKVEVATDLADYVMPSVDLNLNEKGITHYQIALPLDKGERTERTLLAGKNEVKIYSLHPRQVVFDWGKYAKTKDNKAGSEPRAFKFELMKDSKDNTAVRKYDIGSGKWFPSTGMFFEYNRFCFGNLAPETTYWFKIVAYQLGTAKNETSLPVYVKFTTPAEPALDGNVLLYRDFDEFWFRGNPLAMAYGPEIVKAKIGTNIDPDADASYLITTAGINWSSSTDSFFDQVKSTTAEYSPAKCPILWSKWWEGSKYGTNYADADYPGWTGYRVRCCQGAILLSYATAIGYVKTPLIDELGEGGENIVFTCHTAPYFEPYQSWGQDNEEHYIKIEGDGRIVSCDTMVEPTTEGATPNSETCITVKCATCVQKEGSLNVPQTDYVPTTAHVVKIEGATKNTRIVIEAHPYKDKVTKHPRVWIDDIKVERE